MPNNKAYTGRILAHPLYPYSAHPDLCLSDTITNQNITEYTYIELNSVYNDGKGFLEFSPVYKVTGHIWLEKVSVDDGNGGLKIIDQLQHEHQVSFFVFQFGSTGENTIWPHIQVNTLRRKEDVDTY